MGKLASIPPSATIEDFGPFVDCACAWNRAGDVLDLAQQGLYTALDTQSHASAGKRGKQTKAKAKGKGKGPAATDVFPTPSQSLAILERVVCVLSRTGDALPTQNTIRVVAAYTITGTSSAVVWHQTSFPASTISRVSS